MHFGLKNRAKIVFFTLAYKNFPLKISKSDKKVLYLHRFSRQTSLLTTQNNIKMDISGKIIAVLPERGGVSQRTGTEWKVATYVLETMEQYPKKCCFEVFGTDKIQQMNIQVGQMLTVSVDIDAHEYQGRWYNQIRAWKAVPYDPNAPVAPMAPVGSFDAGSQPAAPFPPTDAQPLAPAAAPAPAAPAAPAFPGDSTDDLPF